MRKGMAIGKGKGYKNLIAIDPSVHSQSARGMKQPQRMPYYAVNPALAKYSNKKLEEGMVQEHMEHPKFSMAQAQQIAKDHLTENPRAYGKYVVYSWKATPKEGGIFTELKTEKEAQKLVADMNRIHKTNEWVYANPKGGKCGGKLPANYTFQDFKAQTMGLLKQYKRTPNFASLPKAEQKRLMQLENKIKTATTTKELQKFIKDNVLYFSLAVAPLVPTIVAQDPYSKGMLASTGTLFAGIEYGILTQKLQEQKKEMKLAKRYVNKNFPDIPDKQKEDLAARLARQRMLKGGKKPDVE